MTPALLGRWKGKASWWSGPSGGVLQSASPQSSDAKAVQVLDDGFLTFSVTYLHLEEAKTCVCRFLAAP